MLLVQAATGLILIDRGDDQTARFTVKDSAGAVVNVSAGTFKFTVKSSPDDAIGSAKFQKTSPAASGIDLTLAASGIVDVLLTPVDTQSLAGDYFYDVEMTLSGKVRTLANAVFRVRKDVTTVGVPGTPASVGITFPAWIGITDFLYWKDAADAKWVKFRLFNRNMEYVSESVNPPPF